MKNANIKSTTINANTTNNVAIQTYKKQALNKASEEIKKIAQDISELEKN
jgi:hypothetical protein